MASRFINELRVSLGAEEELAAHGMVPEDAIEVWLEGPTFVRDKVLSRDLMIGRTVGGELLTIVIEPTPTYGAWDVVTGWPSDADERSAWRNDHRRLSGKHKI
jgi:hypothetical protein